MRGICKSVTTAAKDRLSIRRNASCADVTIRTSKSGIAASARARVSPQVCVSSTISMVRGIAWNFRSRQEAISDAGACKEVTRAIRLRLQLLPEPNHVSVYRTGIRKRLITPDRVQND